ncbi:PREDICTED: folylpolyglutamate synthase [Nicotiana attenuata]|uniref:Folylpolyglutamate synthase n=1 Tax=Nicotiana attenuata TaxID=49451 RepID=A0A1J6IEP0_NICAT|nr:PREDICTED: folylpolyglutamate synthase [Nicotiana attenuata]OIS98967.1 folylpolyglutamate synthase [Nicotiana attenuata]
MILLFNNLYFGQEIMGHSKINASRRDHFLSGLITWMGPNSPSCTHTDGVKKLQGLRYRNMSSRIVGKFSQNSQDISQEFQLPSAYESAMEALSTLITQKKRNGIPAISGQSQKLDRMLRYIKILGLEEEIAGLKIIHVAGTKGKGSTCAFCEAVLRECGFKTGLFTSPHLIDVRERYRLDGMDICQEKFLQYFWGCWNQLKANISEDLPMPPLFQFLTVLAFKIFVSEKVDVAIIEVGLGGKLDSTNVIKEPVVCGITSLGMDHMETLGDTLGQIASHKAGILKPQVPAFSVLQLSDAMEVLQERAKELKVSLQVVPPLTLEKLNGTRLSLSGDHQLTNAALAVSLCKSWLRSTGNWKRLFEDAYEKDGLPEEFLKGLSAARLSGRGQIVADPLINASGGNKRLSGDLTFYLDGAHSPESMDACARWFSASVVERKDMSLSSVTSKDNKMERARTNGYIKPCNNKDPDEIPKRILLFNCMDARDPQILLPKLVNTCASSGIYFSKAIFVPSISAYTKVTSATSAIPSYIPGKDLSWQFNLQRIWEKIIHGKDVLDQNLKINASVGVPPHEFLYKEASRCGPEDGYFTCSAVFPSLPLTINWLRDCVRENPSLRLQVLVTGSLHLVGDVLKLLRR